MSDLALVVMRPMGTDSRSGRVSGRHGWITQLAAFLAAVIVLTGGASARASEDEPFGPKGTAAGQLSGAVGVAVDDGNSRVYVLDHDAARMSVFNMKGEFQFAFGYGVSGGSGPESCTTECQVGQRGSRAGQFRFSEAVAIDSDPASPSYHDIYVYEAGGTATVSEPNPAQNLRVQKFAPNGEFLLMFGREVNHTTKANICTRVQMEGGDECGGGHEGTGPGEFTTAEFHGVRGLAVDSNGHVWVDQAQRIEEFDDGGKYLAEASVPLLEPEFLAFDDGTGEFYSGYGVISRGGYVAKYASTGSQLFRFPDTFGGASSNLNHRAIATDDAGDLFVWEVLLEGLFARRVLLEYDRDGDQIKQWDVGPSSDGSFGGIAFSEATQNIYKVNISSAYEGMIIHTPPPGPLITEGSVKVTNIESTCVTLGALINPEGRDSTFKVEYVSQDEWERGEYLNAGTRETAESALVGNDFGEYRAEAHICGLVPETMYHYRVVARNQLGTVVGTDETFTTKNVASFARLPLAEPNATAANFTMLINPEGLVSKVTVAYGRDGGAQTVQTVDIAATDEYVPVAVALTGLVPQSRYRVRVSVENEAGHIEGPEESFELPGRECPNDSFRVGAAGRLPDCRAYEQVTPVEKNGQGPSNVLGTSVDGDAIAFGSLGVLLGSPSGIFSNYTSRRVDTGWSTTALDPPTTTRAVEGLADPTYVVDLSDDLASAIVQTGYPLNAEELGVSEHGQPTQDYLRDALGTFTWLSRPLTLPDTYSAPTVLEGGSADLSQVIVQTTKPLTNLARRSSEMNLYRWSVSGVESINTTPNGAALLPGGAEVGTENTSSTNWIQPFLGSPPDPSGVSADGLTVFFASPSEGHGIQQLYRHHDGATEEVSLSQRTGRVGEEASGGVDFIAAAKDGGAVVFAARNPLTDLAPASGMGFYEYRGDTRQLSYLGADESQENPAVLGASGDLSYVALAVTVGTPRHTEIEEWHNGAGNVVAENTGYSFDEVVFGAAKQQGDLSQNGRYLVFTATTDLTPYRAAGHPEVYEYDANTRAIVCVSCRPDGGPAVGAAYLFPWKFAIGRTGRLPYDVSNTGEVWLESTEDLVDTDTNGTEDVYEYADGVLYQISTGGSSGVSETLGADPSGENVFVVTYDKLTESDTDGVADIYDVRVDGGYLAPEEVGECDAADCRGVEGEPVPLTALGSELFTGIDGNLALGGDRTKAQPKRRTVKRHTKTAKSCGTRKARKRQGACRAAKHTHHRARQRKSPRRHNNGHSARRGAIG